MSVEMTALVFSRFPGGGGELLLALALADHAHNDGAHIFPSVGSLSKKTRQSSRTVQRQLSKLVEDKWLLLVHAGGRGPKDTSEYKINPAWISGKDYEELKGDKMSPLADEKKGDIQDAKGDTGVTLKGDIGDNKGDIAVSPEPSINHQYNHQEPSQSARETGKPKSSGKVVSENQNAVGLLSSFGVPREAALSWIRVRNKKQMAITREAIEQTQREAEKLKLTLVQAITICCANSWAGFKASWNEAQEAAANLLQELNPGSAVQPVAKSQNQSAKGDWWSSDDGVLKRGAELDVKPRPGESAGDFKQRVFAKHRERQAQLAAQVAERQRSRGRAEKTSGAACGVG